MTNKQIATRIADDLLTGVLGKGVRLQIRLDGERDGGGHCRDSVINVVERALDDLERKWTCKDCGHHCSQNKTNSNAKEFVKIGAEWIADSSLGKWFPMTTEELDSLRAELAKAKEEIERLTNCLNVANGNHEKFERLWYLEKDKLEAATQEIERLKNRLQAESQELVKVTSEFDSLHASSGVEIERLKAFEVWVESKRPHSWECISKTERDGENCTCGLETLLQKDGK